MFDVGDVVFARLEGYPEWPARVISPRANHLFNLGMKKIPPNMHLVLFYNDNGNYAATDESDLRTIDDPRLQKRTRDYKGQFYRQLRVAFKSALQDHRPSKSDSIHRLATSASPNHRKRPKNPPPSHPPHPTSPVTGHSDLRQSALSQRAKRVTKLPNSSPSSPHTPSKLISPSRSSIPPTITSRTHIPASISTPPSRSPQSSTLSIPVKLRLRRKRSSTASEAPLQSPHPDFSSPSPKQTMHQPSPKRRRQDTNTEPNYTNQSQTEHSNGKDPDMHKLDTLVALPNAPREVTKPHIDTDATKKTEQPCANMPVTGKRSRTARPRSEQHTRRHENDNRKNLRDPQNPARTSQRTSRLESKKNADSTQLAGRRHRPSRIKTVELIHSDDDPIANGSSSSERERQSNDIGSSPKRGKLRHASDLDKVRSNDAQRDTDSGQRPSKRRKTDESRDNGPLVLEMLSKKDCSEVIKKMMDTIRFLHVEKWQDGYKHAGAGEIVKTEKQMSIRCRAAIQKAEELLRIMEGEERDKREVTATELEAFKGVRGIREIYFDVKTMNLRKVGRKMMSLGRALEPHSTKVWSAIRDVLVMWADLTTECVNEDAQETEVVKKEKDKSDRKAHECKKANEEKVVKAVEDIAAGSRRKVSTEVENVLTKERGKLKTMEEVARNDKKELSAREERLMKFDRKTLLGAVETILEGVQEGLELDGRERTRFTRKVEEAIRPRFEDDRSGYYEASVKVMKGLKRALKDLKAQGTDGSNKRPQGYAKILVSAIHDETGEKARLLVTRLLR